MGDGFFLRLQGFQFLLRGFAGAALEVVDECFQRGLDDGGGDGFAFLGFVGGEFLPGFHGFGEFALGLADGCLQRLNRIGL